MDEFAAIANKLKKGYELDRREFAQKNKDYFSRLCDAFNDYCYKYNATAVLIDQGEENLPGIKVEMPWTFRGNNNLYRNVRTDFTDFATVCAYMINRTEVFKIISLLEKGGKEQ